MYIDNQDEIMYDRRAMQLFHTLKHRFLLLSPIRMLNLQRATIFITTKIHLFSFMLHVFFSVFRLDLMRSALFQINRNSLCNELRRAVGRCLTLKPK